MQSLRELFRIGMGPSSSHTMAPRRAAEIFLQRNPGFRNYRVLLYGSLAATGRGHFTDRAILSVLGGERTEIVWNPQIFLPYHPNGMTFQALNEPQGGAAAEWTVFSVGGGALREPGEPEETRDCYCQKNFAEIVAWAEQSGNGIADLVFQSEPDGMETYLNTIWQRMGATIRSGLENEGVLPGGLQLRRKAASYYRQSSLRKKSVARSGLVAAYALATAEENAACGTIVTAPTCGSCGILPAVLYFLKDELNCSVKQIIRALATAGLAGNVAKTNGSISGAEVGCQGEVGVACAMAAAAAAELYGGTPSQIEYAAEIGLEHCLGLTCDPVMGLVQIPCIERNALAANRALTAAEYALLGDGRHRVSYDNVIEAMMRTGRDLPALYRETSTGGLAAIVEC